MTIHKIREYSYDDALMLETSNTLHSLFNDNIADFTAFDGTLDAAFATDWLTKIDAAGTVVRDSQIKDIQAQLTNIVGDIMDLCRKKYTDVKYFATKAFPKDTARHAEFGTDTYMIARNKQKNMVAFMDEMYKSCVKYSLELLAAGMTQAMIDEMPTLRNNLMDANSEQENYMRGRPVLTQERISTLNTCYATTRLVVDAAMQVYYNDYARRNMFVFKRGGSSGNGDTGGSGNTETINMNIMADNQPVIVFSIAYEPTRQYTLQNNGPAEVEFYIATDLQGMGNPIMLLPGDNMSLTAADLGPDGDLLIAKAMMGPEPEANINVVISLDV